MINTREIAREYRLSHWAQVMNERAQSGLSIKAFCKQVGICGNTYFYWQRRLREAACQELIPETRFQLHQVEAALSNQVSVPDGLIKPTSPGGWVQVGIVEEPRKSEVSASPATPPSSVVPAKLPSSVPAVIPPPSVIYVEINGCRLTVDNNTDPDLLTRTCRALISL